MTGAEWKKELRRMPLTDLFRLRDGIELMNGVKAFQTEFSGFGFLWLQALIKDAVQDRVDGVHIKKIELKIGAGDQQYPQTAEQMIVPECKRKITEDEKVLIGWEIIKILNLRRSKEAADMYQTAWGTKTALGIYETVTRIIAEGAEQ